MRSGDRAAAIEELWQNYKHLVMSLAGQSGSERYGARELIQDGVVALIEAADRYDVNRQSQFSTFVYRSVFGQMKVAVGSQSIVRAPGNRWMMKRYPEETQRKWEAAAGSYWELPDDVERTGRW